MMSQKASRRGSGLGRGQPHFQQPYYILPPFLFLSTFNGIEFPHTMKQPLSSREG